MLRKKYKPKEIVAKLRQVDAAVSLAVGLPEHPRRKATRNLNSRVRIDAMREPWQLCGSSCDGCTLAMSYISSTIGRVLDDINRSYFLPAIQRPYVWQPEQIVALFDSLFKGYPISSFLFWEIQPERRADWEIYKFIENFRHGDTHNELAEPDGRDVKLVLDGQQRLTSLLIGLRGTYAVRAKYGRRHNPDAWSRQRLFFDLLKDPATDDAVSDDEDIGVTYGLRFFEQEPKIDAQHLWLKVGRILDCKSDDAFDRLKDAVVDALPDDPRKYSAGSSKRPSTGSTVWYGRTRSSPATPRRTSPTTACSTSSSAPTTAGRS